MNREQEIGLIHIYCGDGQGKTSAAVGLAVRAAGSGKNVLFARFLKTEDSGELPVLDRLSEIDVLHMKKSFGFFSALSEKEKREAKKMYADLWDTIRSRISPGQNLLEERTGARADSMSGRADAGANSIPGTADNPAACPYDVLILDEFMAAVNYGLVAEESALAFLQNKPAHLEVVLTGRNPKSSFVKLADYVSDVHKVKHPYDRGITARKGIEY